jgi:hypothetical protein
VNAFWRIVEAVEHEAAIVFAIVWLWLGHYLTPAMLDDYRWALQLATTVLAFLYMLLKITRALRGRPFALDDDTIGPPR